MARCKQLTSARRDIHDFQITVNRPKGGLAPSFLSEDGASFVSVFGQLPLPQIFVAPCGRWHMLERPITPDVSAAYCGNREITDELLALYLLGKKTAGSGIVRGYETAGDPLPKVGGYWIILDSRDDPRCIVRTVRVVFNRFKDIPAEIAMAEGEGDCSVAYWKRMHAELYTPFLKNWGITDLEEAEVVTEFFEVVYK